MKTNLKENNKGFSLVELIVVMAIMGILAVTMAPRLTHYIDKARQTADREAVNTVYTAVKYALFNEDIYKVVKGATPAADETAGLILADSEDCLWDYDNATGIDLISDDGMYRSAVVGDKTYKLLDLTGKISDAFYQEVKGVVGDTIKFKSSLAQGNETLILKITDEYNFSLTFDYDGNVSTTSDQYVLANN